MKTPLFITFEGGEGAGKTSLIARIEKELIEQNIPVLSTREPGGTQVGEQVRNLLLHHEGPLSPYAELSLFLASRAQHIEEKITPALQHGKVVLCDRFNDSTIAYQGGARGLGVEQVASFCDFITATCQPNLTLYLDIDPEIGLKRASLARGKDRIESEDLWFHQKIRNAYLSLYKKNPERIYLIDASQTEDEVFKQALKILSSNFSLQYK